MSRDAWGRYTAAGSWCYEVVAPGFKYNMTDLEAALGLAPARGGSPGSWPGGGRWPRRYTPASPTEPAIEVPAAARGRGGGLASLPRPPPHWSGWTIDRDRFLEDLRAENIGATVHFIPIHYHPYYRDGWVGRGDFPVAEEAYRGSSPSPSTRP